MCLRPSRRLGGGRGQTAVLGVVLLTGIVAIASLGIFVLGTEALGTTESQAEQERIEAAFVELSHEMATASANGDSVSSISFDAGGQGVSASGTGGQGAVATSDAGTIRITADGLDETLTMGAIEYEADDGSIVAYQAGGVWRETGEQTRMISPPPVQYDADSETITLPVATVSGDRDLTTGEVTIAHNRTTPFSHIDTVEMGIVTIEIESEYCVGWEMYFESETGQADGQAIRESCDEGEEGVLRVALGQFDIEEGTFSDGIVTNEMNFDDGGDEDNINYTENDTSHSKLDDIIHDMIEDVKNSSDVTEIDDSSGEYDSGTYFAESLDLDNNDDLVFDLSDGNATLIVEDDILLHGGSVHVRNADEHDSLQIFSGGNLHVDGGGSEMCVDPCGNDNNGEVTAQNLQVYGTSDMHIATGTGKSYFEGMIYAPTGKEGFAGPNELWDGDCDEQLCMQSETQIDGSAVVSSAYVQSSATNASFDNNLDTYSPKMSADGYVFPAEVTYLNVAVHELDVEN